MVYLSVAYVDYTLGNPDVLSKYKDAATIAHKVLDAVVKLAVDGATVLSLCEQGDKLLEEETAKVYKGKKISKGMASIAIFPFYLFSMGWMKGYFVGM